MSDESNKRGDGSRLIAGGRSGGESAHASGMPVVLRRVTCPVWLCWDDRRREPRKRGYHTPDAIAAPRSCSWCSGLQRG
jgi:hypothetical protein